MATSLYQQALATPGVRRFVPAGLVGRLPISMAALGTVVFVQDRTGSYGLGGAVAAAGAVGEAVAAPRIGRLLDRHGQARVLLACLGGHLSGLAVLVGTVSVDAPRPTWFAGAALLGASLPPVGACVRARWSAQLGGTPLLTTAFAIESALDEVVFVLGPSLVTLLSVLVAPAAGLVASGTLLTVGTLALVSHRASDPGPAEAAGRAPARLLRVAATRRLVAMFALVGVAFGALDVCMVAYAREQGLAAAGGVLLGLFAAGSGVSGLVYGARSHTAALERRLVACAGVAAVGSLLPLAGVNVWWMAPLAVLTGCTMAPLLITGNTFVDHRVPPAARTEGFAWLTTAVVGGIAVGSPLSGALADHGGARLGLTVYTAAGLAVAVTALVSRTTLAAPTGSVPKGSAPTGSAPTTSVPAPPAAPE